MGATIGRRRRRRVWPIGPRGMDGGDSQKCLKDGPKLGNQARGAVLTVTTIHKSQGNIALGTSPPQFPFGHFITNNISPDYCLSILPFFHSPNVPKAKSFIAFPPKATFSIKSSNQFRHSQPNPFIPPY
jgi:hypothetical protein